VRLFAEQRGILTRSLINSYRKSSETYNHAKLRLFPLEFRRRFGDYVILGPGSMITVTIGKNGDIVESLVHWPEITKSSYRFRVMEDKKIDNMLETKFKDATKEINKKLVKIQSEQAG
jgi:hypothetical protein